MGNTIKNKKGGLKRIKKHNLTKPNNKCVICCNSEVHFSIVLKGKIIPVCAECFEEVEGYVKEITRRYKIFKKIMTKVRETKMEIKI